MVYIHSHKPFGQRFQPPFLLIWVSCSLLQTRKVNVAERERERVGERVGGEIVARMIPGPPPTRLHGIA